MRCVVVAVLLSIPAVAADEPTEAPSPAVLGEIALFDLEVLLNTEVGAATKTDKTTAEAPNIVSVVTREEARDFGWRSVNQILNRQPGFFPSRDYERRTPGFRGQFEGWNNNHLLLLIDGVPFNDSEAGSAHTWEVTPMFLMKNVEIVRGPGSALYGSTAVNGVVAINTISPKDFGGPFVEARARFGYPLTHSYDVYGGADTDLGEFVLGFNVFGTDGFEYEDADSSFRVGDDGELQKFPVRDRRSSKYLFAKVKGKGALSDVSLQVHHQEAEYPTERGWLFHAPDISEKNVESRQIVALKYEPDLLGDFGDEEFVLRFQRHNLSHNLRFFEDGAFDGFYPNGVSEFIDTTFDELFLRTQTSLKLGDDATALVGVEYTGFFYFGDRAHHSNAALGDVAGGYPPVDGFEELGDYYEPVKGHPVHNVGVYSQLESGRILGGFLSATLGLRYDGQYFTYLDIAKPDRPTEFKTFQQLSPRIGVVAFPVDGLTFKALAGRAFRAPSPLELFGANSFAIASNINELEPETLASYELGADWRVLDGLTWRSNLFVLDLQNQIAYGALNVLANTKSHVIGGAETELLFSVEAPADIRLGGFVNYTYSQLLSESIIDDALFVAEPVLTSGPAHVAKAGARANWNSFTVSLQTLVQGPVARRSTDLIDPIVTSARPDELPPFALFDATLRWGPASWIDVGVEATNLLDTRARIVRPGSHPWDYVTDGRQVMGFLEVRQ
ncbi:MAG: TonB-dependent receptor [Deltaproteobacteria bacterium]|nr:TonB-dependent receptor [Deltaproteobacteria bacterium]